MEEKEIYSDHPAMFRNHPIWFVLSVLLCLVIVGIPILIVWYLECRATNLIVTDQRTTLRRGILSKKTNEVYHDNVRNVQIHQTLMDRIFKVGYIGISSAGQGGVEIEVKGIPNPEEVKSLIDKHRE